MVRLDHKSIIVTGGARGIGRAIVEKCAGAGGLVSFFDTNEAAGRATADDLSAAGQTAEFYRVDVTREDDVERGVASVAQRHGRVDVPVNNAGVNAYFDAVEMTEAQWDQVFAGLVGLTRSLELDCAPLGIQPAEE
jgi:3-oxoacyl-[acyl-carrier protein] reductase